MEDLPNQMAASSSNDDSSPYPEHHGPIIRTCQFWAKGDKCNDSNCKFPHHFFPFIPHSAHKIRNKTRDCDQWREAGRSCVFTTDVCGFAHEKVDEVKDAAMRRNVEDAVARQPWTVEALLQCKGCKYRIPLSLQDPDAAVEMEEHCKTCPVLQSAVPVAAPLIGQGLRLLQSGAMGSFQAPARTQLFTQSSSLGRQKDQPRKDLQQEPTPSDAGSSLPSGTSDSHANAEGRGQRQKSKEEMIREEVWRPLDGKSEDKQ